MDRYDNNTTRFIKAAVTYCRENDWSNTDIVAALWGTFGVQCNQIADAGYQNIAQQYMNEINKGVDRYILEHAKKLITDFCLTPTLLTKKSLFRLSLTSCITK